MELADLDRDARLRLMRFVCSFAWADLEVQDQEKSLVGQMMNQMALDDDDRRQVGRWLKLPPRPEEVDPTDIPAEHRQVFLNTALKLIGADGVVDSKEMETLALFEQLMREPGDHD